LLIVAKPCQSPRLVRLPTEHHREGCDKLGISILKAETKQGKTTKKEGKTKEK
jgi:hypothetical protein